MSSSDSPSKSPGGKASASKSNSEELNLGGVSISIMAPAAAANNKPLEKTQIQTSSSAPSSNPTTAAPSLESSRNLRQNSQPVYQLSYSSNYSSPSISLSVQPQVQQQSIYHYSNTSSPGALQSQQPSYRGNNNSPFPSNMASKSMSKQSRMLSGKRSSDSTGQQFLKNTNDDWFSPSPSVEVQRSQSAVALPTSPPLSTAVDSTKRFTTSPDKPTKPNSQPGSGESSPTGTLVRVSTTQPQQSSPLSGSHSSIVTKIDGKVLPNVPASRAIDQPIPLSKPPIHQQKDVPASSKEGRKEEDWVVVPEHTVDEKTAGEIVQLNSKILKADRFKSLFESPNVDVEKLKKLSWNGIPDDLRATTWQILLGYLPSNFDRRKPTLLKKRSDYQDYVQQAFGRGQEALDQTLWHQIQIDVPRTNPLIKLYQNAKIQRMMERMLYCWAIRHPASGYVQGINDLCTPFLQVFLHSYSVNGDPDTIDPDGIDTVALEEIEADTFWCLSKLLDGIQDNYTHAQPGILRQIQRMKELVSRIDAQLYSHLQEENIDFIQFSFRWMNCLLMRELSVENVIRMWDSYLAEGPDGFSDFHVYVCAAFLVKWSEHLKKLDFQDIIMFLQSLPTKSWTEKDVELLVSEGFLWKSLFHNAHSHLSRVAEPSSWSI